MANIVTKRTVVTPLEAKASDSQSISYIIYFFFGLLEVLLTFRLVFKIMGANPISGFVSFIYSVTGIFLSPFMGIFRPATTPGIETVAVLEPATLVAMVVYILLAWGITKVVEILSGKLL